MVVVFVSHSRRDENIINFFTKVFSRIGIKSIFMELEDLSYKDAGNEIANSIREECDAVIVLLGKNVLYAPRRSTRHTRNWVAFEVGVAAGCKKSVWVFENSRIPIYFPIPYITDYYKYKLNDGSVNLSSDNQI